MLEMLKSFFRAWFRDEDRGIATHADISPLAVLPQ